MSEAMVERSTGDTLAKGALAAGVLAPLVFFIGGIAISDVFWIIGAIVGLLAVALGWMARKQAATDSPNRRWATIGLLLGAGVVIWFLAYMLLAAID